MTATTPPHSHSAAPRRTLDACDGAYAAPEEARATRSGELLDAGKPWRER